MLHNKYCSYYPGRPVGSVASLAKSLNIDEQELIRIANNSGKFWRPGKMLQKKDGQPRPTHNSVDPLKKIQRRIKNVFLVKVEYPFYILGGISSDMQNKRGYLENASLHRNSKILFSEDVKDFFPSTNYSMIHSVWTGVFHFHPDVADVLTKLTTYDNCLPQGWVTSSHLANLALWKHEPSVVADLNKRGFTYGRFVDDIGISTKKYTNNQVKTFVVGALVGMFSRCGYRVKRKKHSIATQSGSSDENRKMRIHNLNVNTRRVTVPKKRRNFIRSAVFRCESIGKSLRHTDEYRTQWKSASGLVSSIITLHPREAEKLRIRLSDCKD